MRFDCKSGRIHMFQIIMLTLGALVAGFIGAQISISLSHKDKEAASVIYAERPNPEVSALPRVDSYADVLTPAIPAVVSIHTAEIVKRIRSFRSPQDALRQFFGIGPQSRGGAVEERLQPTGLGSGVLVSEDGFILTNNHVISADRNRVADNILVQLSDGREMAARVVGRDPLTDLAVLKIDAKGLPHLPLGSSDNLRVGDIVFAVGNNMGVGQTVTMGVISATGRRTLGILGRYGYEDFIQTDASINPGNSGGALLDAFGRLVGINTAIVSRSGGNNGISLAIPTSLALDIMNELIENGVVERGLLGVSIADITPAVAAQLGLTVDSGVLIQYVPDVLPAYRAGLRSGDILLSVNGVAVKDSQDLRLIISKKKPGEEVKIRILRKTEVLEFTVQLAKMDSRM